MRRGSPIPCKKEYHSYSETPFLFLQEMGSYFLLAIGQPSESIDIKAGRIYERIIPKWKELSR
jgi:hypothetical protein